MSHASSARETNGLAIGSFIAAIMGVSVLGLILGIVSLKQCRQSGQSGDGFALAAIWIGAIGTASWVLLFWFLLSITASVA